MGLGGGRRGLRAGTEPVLRQPARGGSGGSTPGSLVSRCNDRVIPLEQARSYASALVAAPGRLRSTSSSCHCRHPGSDDPGVRPRLGDAGCIATYRARGGAGGTAGQRRLNHRRHDRRLQDRALEPAEHGDHPAEDLDLVGVELHRRQPGGWLAGGRPCSPCGDTCLTVASSPGCRPPRHRPSLQFPALEPRRSRRRGSRPRSSNRLGPGA